ncbi:protease, putative [Lachnospiraceae bacterium KM106-2]|nr:protease, putative [Lachnospiraceae bacterium KM106-2]
MKQKVHYVNIFIFILFIFTLPYSYKSTPNTYLPNAFESIHAQADNSYASDYGYQHLNANEKRVYRCFMKTLNKFDHSSTNLKYYDKPANEYLLKTFHIKKYNLSTQSVQKVYSTIRMDNPQFFWIGFTFRYTLFRNKVRTFTINVPTDYAKASKRKASWKKIKKGITECLAKSKQYTTIFDKEKYFHDEIIRRINYTEKNKDIYKVWTHNIDGVFTKKSSVCEGYAKAFQLLLNASGIENIYVTGTSLGQPHAWNMVNLGSKKKKKWYQVDLTWDDLGGTDMTTDYNYSNYITYEYFNCTKGQFLDHKASTPKSKDYLYPLPNCTKDKTYNFYHYMNSFATDKDTANLSSTFAFFTKAIETAINRNSSYVYLAAKNEDAMNYIYDFYQANAKQFITFIPDTYPHKNRIKKIPFCAQPYNIVFCIPLDLK